MTPVVLRWTFMVIDLHARVTCVVLVVYGFSPVVRFVQLLCVILCAHYGIYDSTNDSWTHLLSCAWWFLGGCSPSFL